MTKNTRARELKISGFTLLYPYFMLLKFQLDRTEFDLFFRQFLDLRENNYPLPVFQVIFEVFLNQFQVIFDNYLDFRTYL